MRDFTRNSIAGHVLASAIPVALGMFAQVAYQILDIYFITGLGTAATAGVTAANSAVFVVNATMQILAVSTVALVAQAVGREHRATANRVFNQSLALGVIAGLSIAVLLCVLARPWLQSIVAGLSAADAGIQFIFGVAPGFALSCPMVVLSAALRGSGTVYPSAAGYIVSVVVKAALAPILIAGWGTGVSLGGFGAGLTTTIGTMAGLVVLGVSFRRVQRHMTLDFRLMRPDVGQWRRALAIGLPAGGQFTAMFISTLVFYYAIRDLGAVAQAGLGVGSRVLEALLLPGAAIASAAGPLTGQNYGAGKWERVRETFRQTTTICCVVTVAITAFIQWRPSAVLAIFQTDAAAASVAESFLRTMSWTLIAQGLVSTCSNMFQGLGNTLPSLICSCLRVLAFAVPAIWLSTQPNLQVQKVSYLLAASVLLQAMLSVWLLSVEFRRRLSPATRLPPH